MNIERYKIEGVTATNYACGYPQATALQTKLVELGFSCTSVTDTYSNGYEGTFTAVINSEFAIYFVCNGSNNTDGPSMQVKGNGSDLGAQITCNGYVDSLNHVSYLNIIKTDDILLIGFSDYNDAAYKFDLMFLDYDGVHTCTWLPTTNTPLTLYDVSGAVKATYNDMYNIAIPDVDKGLFRSFLITKNDGFVDMININPHFYNVSTGFPFTYDLPVLINGVKFLPLNDYTLLKLE